MYGTIIHQSDSGNIGQEQSPTTDPTLLGCQGRATPTPRQVAHLGKNPTEVSSPDRGTQRIGDHLFLMGKD
jgi:hypothetical protein